MRELSFPKGVSLITDDSREMLAVRLATQVSDWLKEALASKERALLVVSGGSTPLKFFEALSSLPLDWQRVDITLADERWVDEDHAASNAALVKQHLLVGRAAAANFVALKTSEEHPVSAVGRLHEQLATLQWPIDVLILGMGNDGHTASLFPGTEGLANAMSSLQACAAVTPLDAPHERMTLTYPVLSAAVHKVLHIVGEDKSATMAKVLSNLDAGDDMPVRGFIRSGLNIYWSS